MKQTAVDFLLEELYKLTALSDFLDQDDFIKARTMIFNKAKEMEKEQIIEAHGNKQKTKSNPGSIVTFGYTYTGEMYYNEKFKGIKPII